MALTVNLSLHHIGPTTKLIHTESLDVSTVSDLTDGTTAASLDTDVSSAISGESDHGDFRVEVGIPGLPKIVAPVTNSGSEAAIADALDRLAAHL